MLSKNNQKLQSQKMRSKHQHFTIKKFTVGVASILIGTTFTTYTGTTVGHADQVNEQTTKEQGVASNEVTNKQQITDPASDLKEKKPVEPNATVTQAPSSVASDTSNDVSGTKVASTAAGVASVADTDPVSAVPTRSSAAQLSSQASAAQVGASASFQQTAPQFAEKAVHVATIQALQTALNNKNVTQVILDQNVTNANKDTNVTVDGEGVARAVQITGKTAQTTLDLGDASLLFKNNTYGADSTKKWQLNFKDLALSTNNADGYGVVRFQSDKSDGATVTFDHVTSAGNGVLVYAPDADVTLNDVVTTPSTVTDPNITAKNVNIGDNVALSTRQNSYVNANIVANGNVTFTGKNIALHTDVTNDSVATNVRATGAVNVVNGASVILSANNNYSNEIQNIKAQALNIDAGASLTVDSTTSATNISTPTNWGTYAFVDGYSAVLLENGSAVIDGDLTFNAISKNRPSSGIVAALALYAPSTATRSDVKIGSSGKLVVNASKSPNTRGVYFVNNNHNMGLLKGAKASFYMGHGVSNALWNPDNLVLNEGAVLKIETLQDNNGNTNNGIQSDGAGVHSAPLTLNWGSTQNYADNSDLTKGNIHGTLDIKKDASLKIKRLMDADSKQVGSPLISYGGISANNVSATLEVDHGTLELSDDMQDNSSDGINGYAYEQYLGNTETKFPIYPMGMIAMWGVATKNKITLTDPRLFKLVRNGAQQGIFLRLEGIDNKVELKAVDEEELPLSFKTVAGVKYANGSTTKAKKYLVAVKALDSVNKQGDWSMHFNNKDGDTTTRPAYATGVSFGEADASVTFGNKVSEVTKAAFNNAFNWWGINNLALGTDLIDYVPSYAPLTVKQGERAVSAVKYNTSDRPTGESYGLGGGTPAWVTITPQGDLLVAPTKQTSPGLYNVLVTTYFPNRTLRYTYAPIFVTDGHENIRWNANGALVGTAASLTTHKTSDKNILPMASQAVASLTTYQKDQDGKYVALETYDVLPDGNFKAKNSNVMIQGVKVTWKNAPTTLVPAQSTHTDSEKLLTEVDIKNANVFFPEVGTFADLDRLGVSLELLGATAKSEGKAYQNELQTLPSATDLVDTTALNNLVSTITWEQAPSLTTANAKAQGVVKLAFVDGSYLNVPVTVDVIGVKQGDISQDNIELEHKIDRTIIVDYPKSPAQTVVQTVVYSRNKYTDLAKPKGKQVTYSTWTPVTNTTFGPYSFSPVAGYKASAVSGKDAVLLTTSATQLIVPAQENVSFTTPSTTVVVDFTANDHEVTVKYVDDAGQQVGASYTVRGKTGETVKLDVASHAPLNWVLAPKQQTTTDYTFGTDTPSELVYTVQHKKEQIDNERKVTRQIYMTKPNGKRELVADEQQKFQRTGLKDLVTNDIVWHAWSPVSADFPGYNFAQVKGYISKVNGKPATSVQKMKVTATSPNTSVEVTYAVLDAGKYTPVGQVITVTQGQVPTPEAGVRNKVKLPVSTKYSWQEAPDTSKVAQTKGTVVVTYPDGSKEEVPVEVKVVSAKTSEVTPAEHQPKEQTAADKYTPVGQTVTVTQGQVPTPEAGVRNKAKLPASTKYSWQEVPDTSKVGQTKGTVVVTYPDGSKEEVPVEVKVVSAKISEVTPAEHQPKEQTAADKYTPVGQTVTVTQGQVPTPEAGVRNKAKLPASTKYSWQEVPDTSKVGQTKGTVVVTYPDGSKEEVPVEVKVVSAKTSEVTPAEHQPKEQTAADKYTPAEQPATMSQGQVFVPEDSAKNKANLPTKTKGTVKVTDLDGNKGVVSTETKAENDLHKTKLPVVSSTAPRADAEKHTVANHAVMVIQDQVPKVGVKNKAGLPAKTKGTAKVTDLDSSKDVHVKVEEANKQEHSLEPEVQKTSVQVGKYLTTVEKNKGKGTRSDSPKQTVVKVTNSDKHKPATQKNTYFQSEPGVPTKADSNKTALPAKTKKQVQEVSDTTKEKGDKDARVIKVKRVNGPKKVALSEVSREDKYQKGLTDADKYMPVGKVVTVVQGQELAPEAGVANRSTLPAKAKYSWHESPVVTKVGKTHGVVTILYPDKTKDMLVVSVFVREKEASAMPQDKVQSLSQTVAPQTEKDLDDTHLEQSLLKDQFAKVVLNNKETPKDLFSTTLATKEVSKAQLPQTGETKVKHLGILGTLLTLSAFFLGYEDPKKKHENE
ncbi:Rib/alpha-like domain-containing protein [Ligilactobacillus faecis]|uniref:Rib/alpha-like domain-containing protein n=1 Tax=Ligilactobacillus faecis TaxID=762833 RepID=UPI00246926EC|nr:Rib/alpha-like domain-containing protein [Ligilactobacillus faecis]WGN90384.1 Rib/alpha-like domain-containing protein [Ligilactobacillus faecis]